MAKSANKQATALVSFPSEKDKEEFRGMAESYGLSLSAFLRLAAQEYVYNHPKKRDDAEEEL